MRVVAFLAVLALAGCDAAPVQSSGEAGEVASAMQTEAEKACAEMTNNLPEKLRGLPAETQALVKREFKLCVEQVTKDEPGVDQAGAPPGLRGRMDAPPS